MTTEVPVKAPPRPPPRRRPDRLRRAWREFRSMRTALVLLLLLAAGSILGSLFPQRGISPARVDQYASDHPGLAPLLDRLGLFDVFGSAWYTAIYAALLVALVGCLLPRAAAYWRLQRARPPRPGRLDRYRNRTVLEVAATPEAAAGAAGRVLARRRFRVDARAPAELAAEKGYLREAGSLLFHVSFLLLLLGLAYGKGDGYRGQATIVEGDTWANARFNYDAYTPGRFFGDGILAPFSLRLDSFRHSYWPDGTPRAFVSQLAALDGSGRQTQAQRVAPNRPMTVDGVRIFQSDYGYAPVLQVRDRRGQLLQDDWVLTQRDPGTEISTGALKLPSLRPQVGLELVLFSGLRTAPDCPQGAAFCNDPTLDRPVLVVLGFQGDLQAQRAQSVLTLDQTRLRPLGSRPLVLPVGRAGTLPGGLQVRFAGLKHYSVFTLARDPGVPLVAVGAALVLLGLLPSLYVTRRRVWARATARPGGGARLELAGIALQGKQAFVGEFAALAAEVGAALAPAGRPPGPGGDGSPPAPAPATLDRVLDREEP